MVYNKSMEFYGELSASDYVSDKISEIEYINNKLKNDDGPFFSHTILTSNISLPSVLTDRKLFSYGSDAIDPQFEGILYKVDQKIAFRHRSVRERFFKFADKVSEVKPIIFSMSEIFSIFEDESFKRIISLRSINDMLDRSKILISVLTFETERVVNPATLQDLFGFTPAEGRLAVMLVNGKSVIECAEELGIRISTVREQLSNLFGKTRTSRQPELISMLSRLDLLV